MSASILPFPFSSATSPATRTGCSAAGTGASHRPPAGAQTLPADLEALATAHAETLRMGSICDQLADLIERATDERSGYAHRPIGVMADVALDGLLKVKDDLDATVRSLSIRGALAEARDLDAAFADMTPDDQAVELGFLRADQKRALLWAQAEAMAAATGGAA